MVRRYHPESPLRPQPTWPSFQGTEQDLIDALTTEALRIESLDSPSTDSVKFDVGTWLLESLSHERRKGNAKPRTFGPNISEALSVLSATKTEPTITITLTPSGSLQQLLDQELHLEKFFDELVAQTDHFGINITFTVTNSDTATTIEFPTFPDATSF